MHLAACRFAAALVAELIFALPAAQAQPPISTSSQTAGSKLDRSAEVFIAKNYHQFGPKVIDKIAVGRHKSFTVYLVSGVANYVIASCQECGHFDVSLYDDRGKLLVQSGEDKEVVIINANPTRSGLDQLEIAVPNCHSTECEVGLLVLRQASPSGVSGSIDYRRYDGSWHGQITCAKLSFTKGAQKVPMTMTVSGGQATYSRQVYNKDNTAVVGTERGNGSVASDGAIKLTATWKSTKADPKYTYTASYRGGSTASAAHLSGTQVWMYEGKTENRACSIVLSR